MNEYDVTELDGILELMKSEGVDHDPGGETEWIEALSAWCVDNSERLDPAKLAQKLATIWEIGNLVEKELANRFQIRATWRAQFPYVGEDGELMAGTVETYTLKNMSEDPREIACAIAAEVNRVAQPHHNVVLFRRLVEKVTLYAHPLKQEYRTSFGLARV